MSRRMAPSSSRSMASWAPAQEWGTETGLPLVMCPICGRERVIELVVRTEDNGNQGRVFFKCPRNVPGMPGRCRFYEFQRTYLKKLVELRYVVIDLEACGFVEEFEEEVAQSKLVPKPGKNTIEMKIDGLIAVLKLLVGVLVGLGIVGFMYALK